MKLENEMLHRIKDLAKELNIVILLLEKIDIKFEGNLNMVLKMKNSNYRLIITKNDGGPTGTINLAFDKDLLLFKEKNSVEVNKIA